MGDSDVAYRVIGNGPFDVVFAAGVIQIDAMLEYPPAVDYLTRLASGGRLILFDRRGLGASDGVPGGGTPTWEDWTEDVTAVLDAVGSTEATIFAETEGGPIAMLFAAMQPQRVRALVLANTYARFMFDTDYPFGADAAAVDNLIDLIRRSWGSPELMRLVWPSRADDDEFTTWIARMTRGAATPRVAAAYFRYIFESVDVRQVLPLIQAPTLILHNRGNPFVPVEHGRYVADHIAGARLIEFPGEDTYLFPTEWPSAIPEIAEFITGERPPEIERILTTVLFSDIVGSTTQAAALGDQRWRSLLDAHDRAVREQFRRFRGREINTTGDGFLASFDGPARAIRCGEAIIEATRKLGVQLRVGLHTGECEVRGDDLGGLSVHIAARVAAMAGPDEVLVSGTVKDLVVGSGIDFAERGEHDLKGVPGTWKLFAVDA